MLTKLLTSLLLFNQIVTTLHTEPYYWTTVRSIMTPTSYFRSYCFILSLGFLFTRCSEAPTASSGELPICEQFHSEFLTIPFEFTSKQDTIPVHASHNGILETFSIKNNSRVRKGIVVAQIENKTAYWKLHDLKSALKTKLESLNFPKILEPVEPTWRNYGKSIELDKLLPSVPEFSYREEMKFLEENGIIADINEIILAEIRMLPFFTKAPSSGKFYQFIQSGTIVKKGQVIGAIVRQDGITIKPLSEINLISAGLQFELNDKVITTYDPKKKAFVLKQMKTKLNGRYTLRSKQTMVRIPNSVIQNGTIRIVENRKMKRKTIVPLLRTKAYTFIASNGKPICVIRTQE